MNYQQTKTIQKYSINKNLILLGLLIFASFAQGCGKGGGKSSTGGFVAGKSSYKPELIGQLSDLNAEKLKSCIGNLAITYGKQNKKGEVEMIKDLLLDGENITTVPFPIGISAQQGDKTKTLKFLNLLSVKLEKGENKKHKEVWVVQESSGITSGLLADTVNKFVKGNGYKHAKLYFLYVLLQLRDGQLSVEEFNRLCTEYIFDGGNGVFFQVSKDGVVTIKLLTKKDSKYTLDSKLTKFVKKQIIAKLNDDMAVPEETAKPEEVPSKA